MCLCVCLSVCDYMHVRIVAQAVVSFSLCLSHTHAFSLSPSSPLWFCVCVYLRMPLAIMRAMVNGVYSLSSTGGAGGVLDLFYPTWKLKATIDNQKYAHTCLHVESNDGYDSIDVHKCSL